MLRPARVGPSTNVEVYRRISISIKYTLMACILYNKFLYASCGNKNVYKYHKALFSE